MKYDTYKSATTKWQIAQDDKQLFHIRWITAYMEALIQKREVSLLFN